MPTMKIPRKLEKFLTKPKRFKIAYGGRGGGKSQTIAAMLLFLAQTQRMKVGCFREMQNSIEDSVHSLLSDEIQRLGLSGYEAQKATIFHEDGGEFRFKGLSRNPDAIKSMHGFKRFWVEEAQSISEESLTKLTPTLRETDSELWFSLNPGSSQDPMSKRFLVPFQAELDKHGYYEDDLHLIVKINYDDNPWFPDTLEQERLWDYENRSRAEYDHIWLGAYNDEIEDAIIKPEWFDAAVNAHEKLNFKPRGLRVVSHDPSDVGDDPKGLCYRHGVYIADILENPTGDANEGADWATDYAQEVKANVFVYDADGLGLSLKRQINSSIPRMDIITFHGNDSVDDPDRRYNPIEGMDNTRTNADTFRNKRAQYYWGLRDRFFNTWRAVEKGIYSDPDELISINPQITDLQKLRAEVCRIPRVYNGSGRIQIMGKAMMRTKHQIASPNMADSLMMSFVKVKSKKRHKGASPQPKVSVI